MKTVIDAVNELKGNINNVIVDEDRRESFASIILCVDSYGTYLSGKYYSFGDEDGDDLFSNWQFICTFDEFSACVDELSAATWIDGISIEEWKAGMKNTVIDSHGNDLELNKVYEFSNDNASFHPAILDKISNCGSEYLAKGLGWRLFIRECQSPLGTIKKAPVKLVDGKAYQFEARGKFFNGIYEELGSKLNVLQGQYFDLISCTNIIPLVPETK